jgi:S1-C subfamily serine protease
MKAAAAQVAPCVVKIDTVGGAEVIPGGSKKGPGPKGPLLRKGVGPTTGLIVTADGYIITSSFNFVHKPTDIYVTVPGRSAPYVAKVVAHDQTRMLTLLKIAATGLPVPVAVPKEEMAVGQWAIALGRTLDPDIQHPPSMSIGILSALRRIYGKAVQTDAKTSPVNYGGPLVALDGRVYGVIVPLSIRGENETAGVEWYDSGIGFAIPLEDILRVLPRLQQGKDLRRGQLGISPQGNDLYNSPAIIGAILPDSAAAQAGLQIGDVILEVNGQPVLHYSALQHILGPLYEGDVIRLKVRRGEQILTFPKVVLLGSTAAFVMPFLGILPLRDDPGPGVTVRYVYPNSPAATAGLRRGDRIVQMGPANAKALLPVANRAALQSLLQRLTPGTEVVLEVQRPGSPAAGQNPANKDSSQAPTSPSAKPKANSQTITLKAVLAPMPDVLPEQLPIPSSAGRALEKLKVSPPGSPLLPQVPQRPLPAPKGTGSPAPHAPPSPAPPPRAGTALANALAPAALGHPAPILSLPLLTRLDEPPKTDKPAKAKVETGLLKRLNEALGREYWLYVPDNYDSNVSHGLIVWFHDRHAAKDPERLVTLFREFCEQHHFILMGPKSASRDGVWLPSEMDLVVQDVRAVINQYTIDAARIIAHGLGHGGQMAVYVGFNARDLFRAVAIVAAPLGTTPKDNVPNQPLAFFIAAGDKDPALSEIKEGVELLRERRFPLIYREMKNAGKEYLDADSFRDLLLWLDSLDRL